MNPSDAEIIRQRALRALSLNRTPGYHFAGHFLDLRCCRSDTAGVEFELDPGPHCVDLDGTVNLGALALLADMALAASTRVFLDPSVRTATLALQLQFTGAEARGMLKAEARSSGFSPRTALPEAPCTGRVIAAGQDVLRMSGTWVSPPAPEGRALEPLPWERRRLLTVPVLEPKDLDPLEQAVMRRVERALRAARHGDFLRHLWAPQAQHTVRGAASRFAIGMHIGNRVGHVQGGLLLNTALATAIAAVPHHPVLTAVSAWYISPGQGRALTARSTVLQKGRNVAVVRSEVFATGGKRVLEAISNHAIPARH
jgi:acyl-coenzyme A thioesterase PaaI-like protein